MNQYLAPTLILLFGIGLIVTGLATNRFNNRTEGSATLIANVERSLLNTPTMAATAETTQLPTADPPPTDVLPTATLPTVVQTTPIPTDTSTPTITPSAEPSPTATTKPTVTPSAEPSSTVTDEPTVTIEATKLPTATALQPTETQLPTSEPTADVPTSTATASPTETFTPSPTITPPATETHTPVPATATPVTSSAPNWNISYRERFGVSGVSSQTWLAQSAGLNFGSFLAWSYYSPSAIPNNVDAWQTVDINENGPVAGFDTLTANVAGTPGSIWIVGNEPDVFIQDHLTPAQYARVYHDVYATIKSADPSAKVAIAGVASPTPLRRFYLEQILNIYKSSYGSQMPIDVWTIHVYVLREERDSWGIGIPAGLGVNEGTLYEIDDHKNAAIANQLILDFRWWLAQQGYKETPLAVTEFGILLPADYGFEPDVVSAYMNQVVDFYLSARSPETGFADDDNRLVQWWFWFSLLDRGDFQAGNLLDASGNALSPIGRTYANYIK